MTEQPNAQAIVAPKKANTPPLTIGQAAAVFGVSTMAIFVWRRGTTTREPLPTCHNEEDSRFPRFKVSDLRRYAKAYGLKFAREPQDVVDTWHHVKPGPKPKSVVSTKTNKASKATKKKPKH